MNFATYGPVPQKCFLLFPSYLFVLTSYFSCAYHPCWIAGFRSARVGRCGFAFPCFALPRRHCAPSGTAVGGQSKCVGDQLFGRFLSLVHVPALVLGRLSASICPYWYGCWRHSRLARFSDDSLGKPIPGTFLHSEPLAGIGRYVDNRRTFCVRLVARHALRQRCVNRSALVDHGRWDAAFTGSRCRINSLLSGVLHRSLSPTRAS